VKLAYLSYPYSDNPKKRLKEVLELAEKIIKKNPELVLIIPHIAVDNPKIRRAILKHYGEKQFAKWDLTLIKKCDIFIIGSKLDYKISSGMFWELAFAELLRKRIVTAEDLLT